MDPACNPVCTYAGLESALAVVTFSAAAAEFLYLCCSPDLC